MSESKSLPHRLLDDLTENLYVETTTFVLFLATFFVIPFGEAFEGRYLLAMSLLFIAMVYEEVWPVTYSAAYAVLWTVGAGIMTASAFVGVYELANSLGAGNATALVAFVITVLIQYGLALLYSRVQ
jgi:hypothetical protein